ncbi:hypothetical protein CTA2_4844 [Colletotrichum tanaceti]|uniref:Uncharacterized protein n=1 Tax=Colletotrichum tanaceti TaxID=1306861 RepID=A0A4U6X5M7_9PEZI|nr:hypothetical protein CTA2_4844 [Colletotrichum tanaceti]TKW50742.1 hypothetical protein CTA1_8852 [Colletotrichum tanaceti]
MASNFPINKQTFAGLSIFIFFLWMMSALYQTTSTSMMHMAPQQAGKQLGQQDRLSPALDTSLTNELTAAKEAQQTTSPHSTKSKSGAKNRDQDTNKPAPSSSKPHADRPLILYAFAESDTARENLKFFVNQGLHDAADFIFILNGETNSSRLIPDRKNIKVISRNNTCFDLGAHGEVLRKDDLYKKYQRFITMNASIRGPFLPHWAQSCWSDMYLRRITDEVKLVGMTANCWPRFHIQSMIWATDRVGIDLLLNPPSSSLQSDLFGTENDPVGMSGCYNDYDHAVHAEVGSTAAFLKLGYKVDVMMEVFQKSKNYIEECDSSADGDFLYQGRYFGSNIHPYETIFIKTNRDIDPTLIQHLTTWQQASGFNSYAACKANS